MAAGYSDPSEMPMRPGAPLVRAQQILGHLDPKLTARVCQYLGPKDLRSAVARLHVKHAGGMGDARSA